MDETRENLELTADLLGYHLGLVDQETRGRVEAAFETPEALAAALQRVQQFLAPLEADGPADPPSGLNERIVERVAELGKTLPFGPPLPRIPAEAERGGRVGRPAMNFRELISLAAAIALFVGIFVPGYRTARSARERAACASNLRTIGTGLASYAEIFGDQWPYAGPAPADASWLHVGDPRAARFDNARHGYVLVRGRLVPAAVYICPSRRGDFAMQADSPERFEGFPDRRNNSYSWQFMVRPMRRSEIGPDEPVGADQSPLVDEPRPRMRAEDLPPNSRSHGLPAGQNVLHGNLTVQWVRDPNVGINHDDIYRIIGVQEYTGLERPTARSDAFLIP